MPKYRLSTATPQIIRDDQPEHGGGLRVIRKTIGEYFLSCCGMAALQDFSLAHSWRDWQDRAEYLACLYRVLYDKGTVIYVLEENQLNNHLHQALLELGAKEITSYPNGYWGDHMLHVFQFNVRNIAGRYCDRYGEAYASASRVVEADVIPEQTKRGQATGVNYCGGFATLPTKPR